MLARLCFGPARHHLLQLSRQSSHIQLGSHGRAVRILRRLNHTERSQAEHPTAKLPLFFQTEAVRRVFDAAVQRAEQLHTVFTQRPYTSNAITALILWTLGDILAQLIEKSSDDDEQQASKVSTTATTLASSSVSAASSSQTSIVDDPAASKHEAASTKDFFASFVSDYDVMRTVRMAAYGMFVGGPALCWWYLRLHKLVPQVEGRGRAMAKFIATKVALDQFVFCPPEMAFFFVSTSFMEGGSWADAWARLRQDFLHTFIMDIYVWVPLQIINFLWVPHIFQGVFVHVGNLGWNAYLSHVKHSRLEEDEEE